MPIGTPYAANVERHGNSDSTSDTIAAGANLTDGDLLILWTFRSNESTTGRPTASAAGWTHVEHFDPSSTFKGVIDLFGKYVTAAEDGTTPTYTVEWNENSEFGKVLGIVAIPGGDVATLTGVFDFYDNVDEVTFPADTLDYSIHLLGNTVQDLDQSGAFPAGDTLLGWSNSDSFRNAGFAESGGSTTSGTFASTVNGSFGTISVASATDAVTAQIVDPVDGEIQAPDQPIGSRSATFDRNGLGISGYGITVNNLTDGTSLTAFSGGFGSPLDTEIVVDFGATFNGSNLFPANYDVPSANFEEGKTYEFKARGLDGAGNWGPYAVSTVTVGQWDTTTPTTGTMAAPSVSGSIDSHAAGFVIDEDDTEIVVTGTAAGAPSTVDLLVNGTAVAVTDTGTDFDTWSVTVDRAANSLDDGDPVALVLEADSVTVATTTGRINEQPNTPAVTAGLTDGQTLPAGSALPPFTVNVNDQNDGINLIRFRLRRLSDGLYYDAPSATWVTSTSTWMNSTRTFTPAELPAAYTFEDGVDGIILAPDLGVDESYILHVNARDDSGTNESTTSAITIVVAPSVSGSIDSHAAGFVIDEDDTEIVVTGTAAGAPSTVDLLVNGTAVAVTDTGTDFDTWSVTVDRAANSLDDGDPVALVLEADSVTVATTTGRINEQPNTPQIVAGLASGQVLPAGSPLPSFTIDVNDETDGIMLVAYRIQRLNDGLFWDNSSSWVTSTAVRYAAGVSFTAEEVPTTYTFEDGKDGVVFPVLDSGVDYLATTTVFDDSGTTEFLSVLTSFSVAEPVVVLTIDTPVDGSIDVNRTGVVFSGDIDDNATGVALRVIDDTNGLVLTPTGSFVPDTGTNHPLTVTIDTTSETWSYGPVDLPAGVDIRATIETD